MAPRALAGPAPFIESKSCFLLLFRSFLKAEIVRPGRGDLTLSGFIVAACVAIVLVCAAYWLSLQQSRAADWVSQSRELLNSLAKTRAGLVDIQNGHRGFTISGLEEDLEPYRNGRAAIEREIAKLRRLVADNPAQKRHLDELEGQLVSRFASAAQLVTARREGGFAAAKSIVDTGLPSAEMARLRGILQHLESEEDRRLADRLADHKNRLRWFWAGITALVAVLLAILAVLYLQVRRRRAAQEALLGEMRERIRVDEELQLLNRSLEALVRERTAELRGANAGLLEAKLRLRDLSSQLITAQEKERRHIARELHDETGQSLTIIRMHLMDVVHGAEGAAARMPDCIRVVDEAIAQIRQMALTLRPTMLDDLGLVDALQWVLEQQSKPAGWHSALEVEDIGRELPSEIQTACFRIAQEALTNAARHARASEVKLSLCMIGDDLQLTVSDNGAGFDLDRYRLPEERKRHFGLISMTERAGLAGGSLDIDTAPGEGTRIRAILPVTAGAAASVDQQSVAGLQVTA
jgi:signal transduction histidine kinase